jgi:lipase chaperone LimK
VGEEAAARLGELDRRREEWSRRVEAFREERARIRASIREEGARGAAEQALLERSFTEQEQLRVRAILRAQGEPLGE